MSSKLKSRGRKIQVKEIGTQEVSREIKVKNSDNHEIQHTDMVSNIKERMFTPPVGMVTIGLSKGCTLNMGDYQSARIDAFIIRNVDDNPEVIEEQFRDISNVLGEELLKEIAILTEE